MKKKLLVLLLFLGGCAVHSRTPMVYPDSVHRVTKLEARFDLANETYVSFTTNAAGRIDAKAIDTRATREILSFEKRLAEKLPHLSAASGLQLASDLSITRSKISLLSLQRRQDDVDYLLIKPTYESLSCGHSGIDAPCDVSLTLESTIVNGKTLKPMFSTETVIQFGYYVLSSSADNAPENYWGAISNQMKANGLL